MFSQPTKALKVCKSVTGEKARVLTTCILPTGCFAILPLFALGRHFFALTHVSWQVGWRFPGCLVLTQVKSLKIPKYQFPPFLQQSLGLNQNSNQERTYSKQKSRTENRLAIGNRGYLHLDGSYLSENPVIVVIVTVVFVSGNVSEQLALLD